MQTSNTIHVETVYSVTFQEYEVEINQFQVSIRNLGNNEYISILVDEWRNFSQEVSELFQSEFDETKILDSCSHESIMYYRLDDFAFALIANNRFEIDSETFHDVCDIVRNHM